VPIKNVSHIAIGVRDMDRSLPFWTEVAGLHVSLAAIEEFSIGGELFRRRGVYLREQEGADEPFIVLDQQLTNPKSGEPKPPFEIGIHHFGFWWTTSTRLPSERGADTATYGEPSGGFVRSMFVRDPDGNSVQFDQRVT
jgi:catechol 2,3-dioxygenase-like lactoylglutathione lyase family enzyme